MGVYRSVVAAALALGACGSPPPAAYVRENALAEASREKGEHAAAAAHYAKAAELAEKPRDAEEARYRAADSYERAGDIAQAEALYAALAAQGPDAERRTRADFALAELWDKSGHEQQAQDRLVAAIRRNPSSGLARRGLARHLDYLRRQGGSSAVLDYLATAARELGATELGETLAYQRARELDEAGRTADARDAYLECANRFPYPGGAYWDDALFRAAEKDLALSQAEQAIAHLQRLLAKQETAHLTGSYERGRYAEAQLKIGEIYRDLLHDEVRARKELRKVWQNHPKSRLVDDALFAEAVLAKRAGDDAGACAPLAILMQQRPDSRYAACGHLLCDSLAATAKECHDYIKRGTDLP